MAGKYHSTYYNLKGELCRIEIHKSGYGGASIEFDTPNPGLSIDWDGAGDTIFVPTTPSKAKFSFRITNLSQEGIITDLANSSEAELTIKFTIDGTLYWTGYIVQDGCTYDDYNKETGYILNISATDGLGRLAEIDFKDTDGSTYTDTETTLTIIQTCLNKLSELQDFWGASDIYLSTNCNWYDTSMPTGNPFDLSRLDQDIFFNFGEDGDPDFEDCLFVLTEICKAWGANIRFSEGRWWITQWAELDEANVFYYNYSKSGSLLSSGNETITTTVDRSDQHRLGQSSFSYLPGLKRSKVTYKFFEQKNYLEGKNFLNSVLISPADLGALGNGTMRFILKGVIKIKLEAVSAWDPHYINMRFFIRYGGKYLKRAKTQSHAGDGSYDAMEWVNTTDYVDWFTPAVDYQYNEVWLSFPFELESPLVTSSGAFEFGFGFWDTVNSDFTPFTNSSIFYYHDFIPEYLYVFANNSDTRPSSEIIRLVENDTSGFSKEYEEVTIIGDGPDYLTKNKIEVYDGADWVGTNVWQVGATGQGYNFTELLAKQAISLQKKPVKMALGGFYGDGFGAHKRVLYSSERFIFLNGSYNTYNNRFRGRWAKVAKVSTATTIDDVRIIPIRAQGTGVATTNIDEPGRIIGTGILQQQALSTITTAVNNGDTVTTIDITNTGLQNLNAGDVLRILDPTTGLVQFYQLAADVQPGDTTASIVSTTATADLNSGSVITLASKFQKGRELNEFMVFDVYGSTEIVNDGDSGKFYRFPISLIGRRLVAIHVAVYDTPTDTKVLTVTLNKGGESLGTVEIDVDTPSDKLDLTNEFIDSSLYEASFSTSGAGTNANGLVVTFEISGQSNQYWITPDGQVWTWL